MTRWIVFAGLFAAALFAAALGTSVSPATAACSGVTERRLLPNGRFETVTRPDCYPDLHSAPMSNSPRDTVGPTREPMPERAGARPATQRQVPLPFGGALQLAIGNGLCR